MISFLCNEILVAIVCMICIIVALMLNFVIINHPLAFCVSESGIVMTTLLLSIVNVLFGTYRFVPIARTFLLGICVIQEWVSYRRWRKEFSKW